MKITPQDFESLKAAVHKGMSVIPPLEAYMARDVTRVPRIDRSKDCAMRYRWDALYASGFNTSSLYQYANDTHIDTALRAIVKGD